MWGSAKTVDIARMGGVILQEECSSWVEVEGIKMEAKGGCTPCDVGELQNDESLNRWRRFRMGAAGQGRARED